MNESKTKEFMDKLIDNDMGGPAETVVGPSVKIQGDLNSEGNIKIEGMVSGKVKTSQSVIAVPGSKIAADVLAGNAVIGGEIQGNLKVAGHLIMQSTAKILGDITCTVLRVEDGAQFTGKCVMNGMETMNSNGKKSLRSMEPGIEPEE